MLQAVTGGLIFLIGMPATGKTWWGNLVAAHYHRPFVDLDAYIESAESESIQRLFEIHGESGFRQKERHHLLHLIAHARPGTIIACGGGTPCYDDNMDQMKRAGTVVYLRTAMATLIERIAQAEPVRPLLNIGVVNARLAELLAARAPIYSQAHYILDTNLISLATFGEILG